MPNRVVRDKILKSDKINKLSWQGEVFFRRLMSVVDDFGLYDARPSVVRAELFPLRLDKVSEPDVRKWMTECSEAGVVRLYQVDEKPFLEIVDFNQTLRIKKPKFPKPPYTCKQMQADASRCMSETESESESETESEIETEADFFDPTEKANQDHLVPEMLKIYKKFFPGYRAAPDFDFKPLLKIAKFLLGQMEGGGSEIDRKQDILAVWQLLCQYLPNDKFWSQKPLKSIANNIQEIVTKAQDARNGNHAPGSNRKVTGQHLSEAHAKLFGGK